MRCGPDNKFRHKAGLFRFRPGSSEKSHCDFSQIFEHQIIKALAANELLKRGIAVTPKGGASTNADCLLVAGHGPVSLSGDAAEAKLIGRTRLADEATNGFDGAHKITHAMIAALPDQLLCVLEGELPFGGAGCDEAYHQRLRRLRCVDEVQNSVDYALQRGGRQHEKEDNRLHLWPFGELEDHLAHPGENFRTAAARSVAEISGGNASVGKHVD